MVKNAVASRAGFPVLLSYYCPTTDSQMGMFSCRFNLLILQLLRVPFQMRNFTSFSVYLNYSCFDLSNPKANYAKEAC